jgi:hypothetical protein
MVRRRDLTGKTYVWIHTEQHPFLSGLKDYSYAGIDDSSKVRHLLKGIKTTELDVCKTQVMASPSLRDYFASTFKLYSTFIKKCKAENIKINVSEVSFARGKGGKYSFGKQGSAGISNVSDAAEDDRFFEKREYHAITPEQKKYVASQSPEAWTCNWERQRERTYAQIIHPLHRGNGYQF